MAWKGFRKESISYISPKTTRQWLKFWIQYPWAYYKFHKQYMNK